MDKFRMLRKIFKGSGTFHQLFDLITENLITYILCNAQGIKHNLLMHIFDVV